MTHFISGHRDLTKEEFDKYYIPALEHIFFIERNPTFVVADCEGADIMAQDYLADKKCTVIVYHMEEFPRYPVPQRFLTKGGYTSDRERDTAMTLESDYDIAFIRPGKEESGTAENIIRRYTMK